MAPLATSPRYSPHQRQRAKAGLPPDGTHKCRPLILVAPRKEGMPQTRRIDSSPPTLAGAAGEAGNAPSAQPPVASFGGGCWECPKWTSTGCCFWRQGTPQTDKHRPPTLEAAAAERKGERPRPRASRWHPRAPDWVRSDAGSFPSASLEFSWAA